MQSWNKIPLVLLQLLKECLLKSLICISGYLQSFDDCIFSGYKLPGKGFSLILIFNFQGNAHSIYAAAHSESQFIKNLWSWAIIILCSLELHVFHLAACLNWQVCVFLSWIFLFYFISVKQQEIKELVGRVISMII